MKVLDAVAGPLIAAAVLLPLVASGLSVAGMPDAAVIGDDAVAELGVRQTMRGENLLGAYSRFHFRHPGPGYFYAMVPLYALSGEAHGSFLLTAVLINFLAVVVILLSSRDSTIQMLVAAVTLSLFLFHAGPEQTSLASNAFLPVLLFGSALFSSAAVGAGRSDFWVPATLLASLAAQSHVAYLVLMVVLLMTALTLDFVPQIVGATPSRDRRHNLLLAGAVFVACWSPAIHQELVAPEGNLSRLARFFSMGHAGTGWGESAGIVAGGLAAPVSSLFGLAAGVGQLMGWLLVVALPLAFTYARSRGNAAAASLSLLTMIGVMAGVISVRGIVGPIHEYLVHWIPVLGVTGLTAVLLALLEAVRRRFPGAARSLVVILSLSLVLLSGLNLAANWDPGRLEQWPRLPPHRETASLTEQVVRRLEGRGIASPEIRIAPASAWPVAAGLVLQLDKIDQAYCVEDFWLFMFGAAAACGEGREALLLVGDSSLARAVEGDSRFERIASAGEMRVYLSEFAPEPAQVDFSAAEAALYLRDGFDRLSRIEFGLGRWSIGRASTLDLPLTPGRSYLMTLRARPLPVAGKVQVMRVLLNQQFLTEFPMLEKELDYLVSLPARSVRARNRLRFEYSYAEPPMRHLEDSTDWRPLAVFFRSLVLSSVGD